MTAAFPSLELWRLLVALLPYRQRSQLKRPIAELEQLAERIRRWEEKIEKMNHKLLFPSERLSPQRLEEAIAERKRLERELVGFRAQFDHKLSEFVLRVAKNMDLRRCSECGLFFRPRVKEHQFCSPTCRNRHWRRMQAARQGESVAG